MKKHIYIISKYDTTRNCGHMNVVPIAYSNTLKEAQKFCRCKGYHGSTFSFYLKDSTFPNLQIRSVPSIENVEHIVNIDID